MKLYLFDIQYQEQRGSEWNTIYHNATGEGIIELPNAKAVSAFK